MSRAAIVFFLLSAAGVTAVAEEIWFEDLQGVLALRVVDQQRVARHVGDALTQPERDPAPLPESVLADRAPRIVVLTVSDGLSRGRVLHAGGAGLGDALARVLQLARRSAETGSQIRWIKLDLVRETDPLSGADLAAKLAIECTLDGLAFDRESGLLLLPEELVVGRLLDEQGMLSPDRVPGWLKKRGGRPEAFTEARSRPPVLHRFRCLSWFTDGNEVVALHRGHRMYASVAQDDLTAAVRAGAAYLRDAVKKDGSFVYSYSPDRGWETEAYNIVRHAGCTWSMLDAVGFTRDRELQTATERALRRLREAIQPVPAARGAGKCVVWGGVSQLGATALATVAMVEAVRVGVDKSALADARELGRGILSLQSPNGEYGIHEFDHPSGEPRATLCKYYPGEAALALVRLHSLDPEGPWLEAAERSVRWIIEVRDAVPPEEQEHDHWLLYALDDIHRLRPKPDYLAHVRRIVAVILGAQHRRHERWDFTGGYTPRPNSTPTATRSEGLGAACRLLRDYGTPEEAAEVLAAIELGVRFQLQTQYRPERTIYFTNPHRSLGGFHAHLEQFDIRNDYVQHNVSALISLHRLRAVGK